MVSQKLKSYEKWAEVNGVIWNRSKVDIVENETGSWGIFAKDDVKEGESIAYVSGNGILSASDCEIADILKQCGYGGGLALTIAVLYEFCIQKKSKWHGYFQSLPALEPIPLFWPDHILETVGDRKFIRRTLASRKDTESDWEDEVKILNDTFPLRIGAHVGDRWTLDNFRRCAAWVSSRAFFVDERRGDAIVPFADIFNHKSSVVALNDQFEVAELARGCDSGNESEGDEEEEEEEDEKEEEEEDEKEEEKEEKDGHHHDHACHKGDCCNHHHHHHRNQEEEEETNENLEEKYRKLDNSSTPQIPQSFVNRRNTAEAFWRRSLSHDPSAVSSVSTAPMGRRGKAFQVGESLKVELSERWKRWEEKGM
eukprot:CAMPEP_0175058802 /NCGR_PEP_ID=MMETSP0052_2-20121109/12059_1 /TAXON_ID=51329 ORGANISM="Polytomella parva, Strain SAG 63-3" /NCGR_SAMPLE_ID=MMETSP0052_2 /ASSEMBLY_ACC=CAM_ASM_000194 /LENGTH=367 /DNA_ID=CAMNT_0016324241 /DNA_START=50 /DNA_END=1150 /DNA_ORIENTATION=+